MLFYGLLSCLFLASLSYGDEFRQKALDQHNTFRARHGVVNLVLNDTLNTYAQNYANYMAANNAWKHSGGPYGENLWFVSAGPVIGSTPVNSWYEEIRDYDFNNPGFSSRTGHFTQLVWKGSKRLGIGYATSANGYTYVVASYDPPGNYIGLFADNVFPPKN